MHTIESATAFPFLKDFLFSPEVLAVERELYKASTLDALKDLARVILNFLMKLFEAVSGVVSGFTDNPQYLLGLIPVMFIVVYILSRRQLRKPDINKLVQNRDVPRLIKALEYKAYETSTTNEQTVETESVTIRCTAATALGNIGDHDALDPLIIALHDPDRFVRLRLVEALSKFNSVKAFKAIETIARTDVDDLVRYVSEEIIESKRSQIK